MQIEKNVCRPDRNDVCGDQKNGQQHRSEKESPYKDHSSDLANV